MTDLRKRKSYLEEIDKKRRAEELRRENERLQREIQRQRREEEELRWKIAEAERTNREQ